VRKNYGKESKEIVMRTANEVVSGVGEWLAAMVILILIAAIIALVGMVLTFGAAVGLALLAVGAGWDVLVSPIKLFKPKKDPVLEPVLRDFLSVLSERSEEKDERGGNEECQ
jgi:hypothetical protein